MTDETRVRGWGELVASERIMERRVTAAISILLGLIRDQLTESGYDAAVLSADHPEWQSAVDDILLPAWQAMFDASAEDWLRERGMIAATPVLFDYRISANQFTDTVRNRLVGVSDTVFDTLRPVINTAREEEFDQRQVARRVDSWLQSANAEVWQNRAQTIARTETFAARNAGHYASAAAVAGQIGEDPEAVAKQWNASRDTRTRESHADANGQTVIGMHTPFTIGDSQLQFPGDPDAPGREVINCRCWVAYLMPGDPGYPGTVPSVAGETSEGSFGSFRGWTPPAQRSDIEEFTESDAVELLDSVLPRDRRRAIARQVARAGRDGTPLPYRPHGGHRYGTGWGKNEYPKGWGTTEVQEWVAAVLARPADAYLDKPNGFTLYGTYLSVAGVVRIIDNYDGTWGIATAHPLDPVQWERERG